MPNRRTSIQPQGKENAFLNQLRYEKKKRLETDSDLEDHILGLQNKPRNQPRLGTMDGLDMFNYDSVRD